MPRFRKIEYRRTYRSSIISSFIYHYAPMLFTADCLFTKAISSPLPDVSHYNGPSSSKLYDEEKTYNVRVAAATCAAISMVAAFTVFYWFCRMEKRFRHRCVRPQRHQSPHIDRGQTHHAVDLWRSHESNVVVFAGGRIDCPRDYSHRKCFLPVQWVSRTVWY